MIIFPFSYLSISSVKYTNISNILYRSSSESLQWTYVYNHIVTLLRTEDESIMSLKF